MGRERGCSKWNQRDGEQVWVGEFIVFKITCFFFQDSILYRDESIHKGSVVGEFSIADKS